MVEIATYIDKLLEEQLLILVDELKARHIELGQKATGEWVNSLEVFVSGGKGVIYGTNYTQYIVKGRPSGKRPPISPLEDWAKAKLGLQGKEALNVAFAVSNKIAREGTETYQQGGNDLIDSVITQQRINKMYDNLGEKISVSIAENLRR